MTQSEQNNLSKLLHDVNELRTAVEERLKREEKFNVMKLLRKESDERYLHSRFIASVLDPKAPHGMKDKYLKLFLETIGCSRFEYQAKTLEILPNYRKYSEDAYTDILLQNRNTSRAVIIENKINAKDQQGQLIRYFMERMRALDYWRDDIERALEHIDVFYLTLSGNEPEDKTYVLSPEQMQEYVGSEKGKLSLEEYESLQKELRSPGCVQLISYGDHILEWLDRCLECTDDPVLKITLNNYKSILLEMTNNRENVEERRNLVEILGKDENWKNAYYIIENIRHIRWHVLADKFFPELFQELGVNARLEREELDQIGAFTHNERKGSFEIKRNYRGKELTVRCEGRECKLTVKVSDKELTGPDFLSNFFSDKNIFELASQEERKQKIKHIIECINEKFLSI